MTITIITTILRIIHKCHRCRHVGGVPVKRFDEATSQLDRRQL
jgi:hypothetical protein